MRRLTEKMFFFFFNFHSRTDRHFTPGINMSDSAHRSTKSLGNCSNTFPKHLKTLQLSACPMQSEDYLHPRSKNVRQKRVDRNPKVSLYFVTVKVSAS